MPAPAADAGEARRRELLIALNASEKIHRAALCRLALDLDAWWDLDTDRDVGAAAGRLGLPREALRRALALRTRAGALAARELETAEREGCRILTSADVQFPRALADLPLPPPVLYCRGELPSGPAVAIVGARKMTPYGREVAELFAGHLARAGVTVVSGFALGVDTTAHRSAVAEGRSVAVLGCGLDVDYPKGNAELRRRLSQRGAVLSEFPFGAPPRPWHFPVRNRVIAALASATLVIQAKLRSGSLITAHHAMELGRDVYAVPGVIFDELALGTNALIADGALVARTPDDILDGLALSAQGELFPSPQPAAAPKPVLENRPDGLGGELLEALPRGEARTAEALAAAVERPVDRVLGALLELELGGWLERRPGPLYAR